MHILIVILLDILILITSGAVALFVRFEFSIQRIEPLYMDRWLMSLPIQIMLTIAVFFLLKLYHFVWHFVNTYDVAKMIAVVTGLEIALVILYYIMGIQMPRSVTFMTYVFKLILFVGMRCSIRFYSAIAGTMAKRNSDRILLIGAGDAGNTLLKEINHHPDTFGKVMCIVDDNPLKAGKNIFGAPIVGDRYKIVQAARDYKINKIIFAIPTAKADDKREILEICKTTGAAIKVLPGIYQLYNGEVSIKELKDVDIVDLLGRDPIRLDEDDVKKFVTGKTVLVTGGGGSIGSELSRQVALNGPGKLVILDIYENNAYEIQQELKRKYGKELDLNVEIASVRDAEKIDSIFSKYLPDIVFHAAAHKHVPLMEDCPDEAIKNNIFGTYNVVCAAEKYRVKKFVMISTDKAVNPTSVMGASKRFCEMILQARDNGSETEFAAVRFGNVLGSNGSVVPLFKQQIAEGGPVTITDKRIIRFFMTIPEAVQLVLQAGAIAERNQVFVLDMGEPVKILDLAENLIRLSGLEPYKDIEIKETGLRPGEKLYEELLMNNEHLLKTENSKIFIEEQSPIEEKVLEGYLAELDELLDKDHTNDDVRDMLKRMVPTYHEEAAY